MVGRRTTVGYSTGSTIVSNKTQEQIFSEFKNLNPVASVLDLYRRCWEPHRQKRPLFEYIFTPKKHAMVNNKSYNNHLQTKPDCFVKKLSLNSVLR